MKQLFVTLRSIIYVPLFILLFRWIALSVRPFDSRLGLILPAWASTAGIILMVIGGMIVLTCVTIFIIRGKGTPAVFDPPREFVAIGPYAYVRNPMYIGGFILLVGFGLWLSSISILILAVILLFLFHLFVIFVEEPTLERTFGKSYIEYKKRTNRWVPRLS
jgi:protein-S-isoprenylcysteine O-methyltransferase Ste14